VDRLERLLDLVHVLQTSRRPVSLADLKDRFDDYSDGSDDAVRRKFERDKAELARIGVVLRYDGDEDEPGYWVDAEATYLPELSLDETDRALLATAAQAALADPSFPHRSALRLALGKLGADTDDTRGRIQIGYGAADGARDGGLVEVLAAALAARKRVAIRYQKAGPGEPSEREVDPYGLFLKRGAWYLVGHDHRSGEVRMFRVARILGATPNDKKPGSPDYAVPDDFDLEVTMRASPLHYLVHEPALAKVRVDPEVAFLVEREWGPADANGIHAFETTYLDYVVDQVLALGARAELLAPADARAVVRHALEQIVKNHEAASDEGGDA
jgi:proteasome accessory factor B